MMKSSFRFNKKSNLKICSLIIAFMLVSLSVFLSSCNFFSTSANGRENVYDPKNQISAFIAVPSGDKSVVTMWNWKEASDWLDSDERIDKVRIEHSVTGYPDLNLFFIGETFESNSEWEHEWDNLIPGITHYFSLFAKTKDGRWYSPLNASADLPGKSQSGVVYDRLETLNIDNAGVASWNSASLDIVNWEWAVVYFDIPDDVYIENATLILSGPSITELTFAPLDGDLPEDDWNKWDYLDSGRIVNEEASVTFTADPPVLGEFEITEVIRAAVMDHKKAVLIKTTAGSTVTFDNNATPPYIVADIMK